MSLFQVFLSSPDATLPSKGSIQAAGYDLSSAENLIVKADERQKVSTKIHIAVPTGYYGRIAPRSGLAVKHGIDVLGGVVDAGRISFIDRLPETYKT